METTTITMTDEEAINLYFRDTYKRWQDGEPCMDAMAEIKGEKADLKIGEVIYHHKDGRTTYSGKDCDGNEIFPETPSLPYAKLQFFRRRLKFVNLAKARQEERSLDPLQSKNSEIIVTRTEPIPSPYQDGKEAKAEKRTHTIKRTVSRSQKKSRGR
ncbi:MAG TPA: hypothetical protein VFU15_09550 [Bacteroidia bacterium]|nr:hypothetical protein [Bacteroidia bacterium]